MVDFVVDAGVDTTVGYKLVVVRSPTVVDNSNNAIKMAINILHMLNHQVGLLAGIKQPLN